MDEWTGRCAEKVRKFLKRDKYDKMNVSREDIVMTIDEDKGTEIVYDKMQGRPSVLVHIKGKEIDCLLDTGARVNVMSMKIYEALRIGTLEKCETSLRCANDSKIVTMGLTTVEVTLNQRTKLVKFIVVSKITPDLIGGIDFQEQFGFALKQEEPDESQSYICNIEANFGKTVKEMERFEKVREYLGTPGDPNLLKICWKNKNAFMANKWDIGCTHLVKHKILTQGSPINVRPRRQPMHLEDKIDAAIENLHENDIIKRCNSQWNTPLVCVWKKGKNDIRLCLDFRQLNSVTERQAYPMPNVDEMLDRLSDATYFSSIDLGQAYYQVELEEESKLKTAFSTKSGQYCFNRMPFGIAAAPGTFQELMNKILDGMAGTVVYLDDILVYSKNREDHYRILDNVLKKIGESGLRINPEKCRFLKEQIKFLGHIISRKGIQTDPSKTDAIRTFGRPKCVKNLRSFLGICNYYRKFIKGYAEKSRILEALCGKNNGKLTWTDVHDKAFDEMKIALTNPPVLGFPNTQKEFILDTDASFDTIGAVLSQRNSENEEVVIAYGSHAMSAHEVGYCITRKELLSIYYFCNHFSHYLYGKKFTLRTDHKAITFMLTTKKPITTQFQTWMNYLSSLDIKMEYRPGSKHANADALSRKSCDKCSQCMMQHEEAKKEKLKTRAITNLSEEPNSENDKDNQRITYLTEDNKTSPHRDATRSEQYTLNTERMWIPKDQRHSVIEAAHRILCHAGSEKTLQYMRNQYDMEEMAKLVKEVIQSCDYCQKTKAMTTKTKEETLTISAKEPFEKVYIDICGPLRLSRNRKRYILAMIDHFSKYVVLTAIGRQDDETVKKIIKDKWILRFGAPKEIHVDCGKTFESRMISEFLKEHGVEIFYSSPYHHQTNGMVERQFRTMRDYMNATLKERTKSDWEEILPEIEFSMNATVQKTIGTSPAEIIFGRRINRYRVVGQKQSIDIKKEIPPMRTFEIGDEVLVKVEARSKDDDRYEGPYQITQRIHERRYELRNRSGRVIQRNVEKMKRYFKRGGCEEYCN